MRSFGPKMGLRRPLRKSSDKHNVLGAFFGGPEAEKLILGARNRKVAKFLEIAQKIQFWSKKGGNCKIAGNLPKRYLFCFKNMSQTWHFVILGVQGPQNTKMGGKS